MTTDTLKHWKDMSAEDKTEIVQKLAHDGHSASEIAKRIPGDVSRSAIIGFTSRHGIKLARSQKKRITVDAPRKKAIDESAKPKPVTARKPQAFKPVLAKSETSFQNEPLIGVTKLAPASVAPAGDRRRPFDPLPGVEPLNIIDLPLLGRCHWPVNGDGREALFCGCVTVSNTNVYCETHAQFARPKEAVNAHR